MNRILLLSLFSFFLLCLTGCRQPHAFEVALYPDESLSQGDTVFINGEPLAVVEEIYFVREDTPVARVRVKEKRFEERFVQGIQRRPVQNVIELEPPASSVEAKPLAPDSRIPIRHSPLPPSLWPPNQNTLILAAILLVLAVVLFFLIKSILGTLWITATFAMAAALAYVTYPIALPYTIQAIDFARAHGESSEIQTLADEPEPTSASPLKEMLPEQMGDFFSQGKINAHLASFGITFIVYSVLLGCLFGWIRKRLK